MKKLFIYYSLTGNGDLVANKLKENKYELRKIKPQKELPKSFFWMIMVGGFKAMIKYKEKLIDFDNDISKYDEIIIGSPIWNGRLSTPVSTALTKLDLSDKKVSFILYSGSGEENTKATSFIKEKYNAQVINLKEPNKNPAELEKISI